MNDKSTADKNMDSLVSPPIQRRKSKLIQKPPPIPKKTNCLAWLFCLSSSNNNKIKIKEKYESVLYLPNEDSKEEAPPMVERKPEFNKSLSSDKVNRKSHESSNKSGGKLKSSINFENNNIDEQNKKLSKTEKALTPIVNSNERKKNVIDNYHRRHSCTIAVLKLESNMESIVGQYKNGNNIGQDQGNTARVHKKRSHKGS